MYTSVLHASLIVASTHNAIAFYHDMLEFPICPDRPDLGFPGIWLQVGSQQIHLLEVPNPDPTENRPAHGGRDRHIAIGITDLSQLMTKLDSHNINYTTSKSGRKALFFRDPDSNTLEFIQQS